MIVFFGLLALASFPLMHFNPGVARLLFAVGMGWVGSLGFLAACILNMF